MVSVPFRTGTGTLPTAGASPDADIEENRLWPEGRQPVERRIKRIG
ncbi:MAG: hypothetical protein OEY86_15885 [Nitrospira sp.]|nr:hypothetical protein [Nitrospira sp.]